MTLLILNVQSLTHIHICHNCHQQLRYHQFERSVSPRSRTEQLIKDPCQELSVLGESMIERIPIVSLKGKAEASTQLQIGDLNSLSAQPFGDYFHLEAYK